MIILTNSKYSQYDTRVDFKWSHSHKTTKNPLCSPCIIHEDNNYKSSKGIQLEVGVDLYNLQALLSKHPKRVKEPNKINQLELGFLQLALVVFSFESPSEKALFHLRVVQVFSLGIPQTKSYFPFGQISWFLRVLQKNSSFTFKQSRWFLRVSLR